MSAVPPVPPNTPASPETPAHAPVWFAMIGHERIGPLAHAEVMAMAKRGQIGSGTPLWCEGMAEWLPASTALGVRLRASAGDDSPVIRMIVPVGRSGFAIMAGYLGIFALFPYIGIVAGPFAVLFGVLAVRQIRNEPGARGLGRAWFGIVAGIIGTLISVVIIIGLGMS